MIDKRDEAWPLDPGGLQWQEAGKWEGPPPNPTDEDVLATELSVRIMMRDTYGFPQPTIPSNN